MKQRLVGAIVLVALAVIFLPMLLDGSGRSGPQDIAIELPEEPQPPTNRLEDTRDLADTSLSGRSQDAEVASAGTAPAGTAGSDSEAAAEPAQAAADEPEADGGSGSGSEDSGDAASSAPTADEGTQPAADASGWVIQVGSFTRETNALVLRDRLREADFEAFVERTDGDDSTLWRVRIGPIATREEADRLGERVAEQRGEPTLVMSHP